MWITKLQGKIHILYVYAVIATLTTIPTIKSLAFESAIEIPQHRRIKIASSAAKSERREKERRAVSRALCARCSRPSSVCVCKGLPVDGKKIELDVHVLVLQHPNENRKRNVSTVPLMPLVLENFSKKVGYTFNEDDLLAEFQDILHGGQRPLLLFPGPNAVSLDDVNEEGCLKDPLLLKSRRKGSTDSPSRLLILFDGTWAEAKRMVRDSPSIIDACDQVQFSAATDRCIYDSLRSEPERHCLSTLESCAQALQLLIPNDDNTVKAVHYLTSTLQILVDQQIQQAKKYQPRHTSSTAAKVERNRRVDEIENEIFFSSDDHDTRVVLDDGSTLRKLYRSDAKAVNEQWERRSTKSISLVHRRIELGQACFGIFSGTKDGEEGALCGSILQTEDGSLGMLFVKEEYRRRGYGSALVSRATRELERNNIEGVSYILDGNIASEAVFRICGWVKEDPNIKRQTGSRRSKRKWIYPLRDQGSLYQK